jgi:hypothetical protein
VQLWTGEVSPFAGRSDCDSGVQSNTPKRGPDEHRWIGGAAWRPVKAEAVLSTCSAPRRWGQSHIYCEGEPMFGGPWPGWQLVHVMAAAHPISFGSGDPISTPAPGGSK